LLVTQALHLLERLERARLCGLRDARRTPLRAAYFARAFGSAQHRNVPRPMGPCAYPFRTCASVCGLPDAVGDLATLA
jgi:hypothetical protein